MKGHLTVAALLLLITFRAVCQDGTKTVSASAFAALAVPKPGPTNDAPYAPQPIVQGGIVVRLYPPNSRFLNQERVREAEQYNMSKAVPGRINSIVNIHNPSIEVHTVEGGLNTGAAVILAAGGGHNTLNVGSESADFVPFFYGYGVNTVILRNRLRRDGYNVQTNAVNDALQALRLVRAHAKEWNIDPNKIGIMGFSAGAELAAAAAIFFEEFAKKNSEPADLLAGVSSRPAFVALVYPGPTPFARHASPPIPRTAPPAFIACADRAPEGAHVFNLHGETVEVARIAQLINQNSITPDRQLVTYGGPPIPIAPAINDAAIKRALGDLPSKPVAAGIRETMQRFAELRDAGRLDTSDIESEVSTSL